MISSKVSQKPTEITTDQIQVPSILNNNYIKFGGAFIIFVIFVIILYFSFRSTPSESTPLASTPSTSATTPSQIPISEPKLQIQANNCELFSDCNFKNMTNEDRIKYVTAGISVNEIGTITNITKQVKLGDMYIKSIKTNNVKLTLYSNPDFTGEVMKLENNIKYNIDCLDKPMKSVIIDIIDNIQIKNI
jgi:hypothetical protein